MNKPINNKLRELLYELFQDTFGSVILWKGIPLYRNNSYY